MIKHIWYHIVKVWVSIGMFFLLKKKKVYGTENIPKKGPILLIGNHQNALVDALLIPITTSRKIHFLARAAVFKKSLVNKILRSLNMLPAYRLRDGFRNMDKNYEVFNKCVEVLHNNGAVEIFAEGEHHLNRRIIPLKKGFARIILSTLQKYPNTQIQIVPVGLNYDSRLNYPSSVSIIYGKPILANPYFDIDNPDITFSEIIDVVTEALKKLTLHIEDQENYDSIIEKLENAGVDYLNPVEANEMAKNIDSLKPLNQLNKTNWFLPIQLITKVNSFIPLFIWGKLKKRISDIIFTNTFRFALIAVLFPLVYFIQSVIIYYFFGKQIAIIYLLASMLLGAITTKTMKVKFS